MNEPAAAAHDEHSAFIKTPQHLVIAVLLAFLVPIVGIVMLVQFVAGGQTVDPAALKPDLVAARIQPVGRIELGEPAAQAPAAGASQAASAPDGKKSYETACSACHATGAANAPKLGDKSAWAPRIKAGVGALLKSALGGKGAMPPKGGNAALTDAEIKAAVEYMVSQSK